MFNKKERKESIHLIENHGACLSIELGNYAELFCKKHTSAQTLSVEEQSAFKNEYSCLRDYVFGLNPGLIYGTMLQTALNYYSLEEQQQINKSPAVSLMHDSFSELLKNAIDSFLLQKLAFAKTNTKEYSSSLKINTENTLYFYLTVDNLVQDKVSLIFKDSGAGFSEQMLASLATKESQLAYVAERSNRVKAYTEGLFGGAGLGLRQLICQILTGQELQRGSYSNSLSPGNQVARTAHPLLDSSLSFLNCSEHGGACIKITTRRAPLLLEEVVFYSSLLNRKHECSITLDYPSKKIKNQSLLLDNSEENDADNRPIFR